MSATFVTAGGLVTLQEQRQLRAEARAHHSQAKRYDRQGWCVVDDRQFLGPARFWYAPNGRIREEVHRRLAARVTRLIGVRLRPVQSNYLYYDPGDFLGLHHDQARCPFTVIALLDGDAGPLCVHPELRGARSEELGVLLEPEGHRGGQKVMLHDGPLLFAGGVLPHHRDKHLGSEPISLITFCFRPD
jgi:hypothetical protein